MVRNAVAVARGVSEGLMPDEATVERWTDGTFDAQNPGNADGSWVTEHVGSGRVDLISDRGIDRRVANEFNIVEPVAAVLPAEWDVRQSDRVTVGDVVLRVRAVQVASYRAHLRVIGETEGE